MGNVVGAPAPFKAMNGEEYMISPLTDKDMGEVDIWLRSRVLGNVMEAMPANLSDQMRARLERQAVKEAAELSWMSPEGMKHLATVDGMCRLLWIGARKNHAGLAYETLHRAVMDDGVKDNVAKNIHKANDALAQAMPNRFRPGQTPPKKGPTAVGGFRRSRRRRQRGSGKK